SAASGKLDLGGSNLTLFVFHCESSFGMYAAPCRRWNDPETCLVVAPVCDRVVQPPQPTVLIPQVPITEWTATDDGFDPADSEAFFRQDLYDAQVLPKTIDMGPGPDNKLGGLPGWNQIPPADCPRPPWRFILQFSDTLFFKGTPPPLDSLGYTTAEVRDNGS